jgi:type IV pilus assembly protein PilB
MDTATLAPRRLGSLLVDQGYLTPDDLQSALEKQRLEGRKRLLGEILVEQEHCTEDQVIECLAAEYGVPYAKLNARLLDLQTVDVLPREYVEKNLVLPLFLVRGVLTIAVSEPSNLFLIDEVRGLAGAQVQIVAASPKDIRRMIAALPNSKVFVIDELIEASDATVATLLEDAVGDVAEIAGQSAVIRLVNRIIFNAVKEGASDIHVEPSERSMRVRYRIDGRLHKALEASPHLLGAVTSRIKTMGAMDVNERRLPQDGRVQVVLEGRKIDLRVSTFPAARGEKTVIRLLDARAVSLNLEDLGFAEDVLAAVQANIRAPNGIILVAGPTGSGKSTTLYAALRALGTMENNVCTVEDPIEYHLPMVNQFQVQTKLGVTFPEALRTLLRQDPDVIMVGEIRDEETARAAVRAALSGHLLFSTVHTGDACSAITRLVNMGVEPYLVGAALNMVLAQRLVRRICAKCRAVYEPPRAIRRAVERMGGDFSQYYRGTGCRACRNTGFRGRIGIHELLVVGDVMRDAILANPAIANLRKTADAAGMITLSHDGFRKVREGITTLEEIFHVLGDGGNAAAG